MRTTSRTATSILTGLLALGAHLGGAHARADDLESDTTWDALRAKERSLVFGRLRGPFDGIDYRGRRIRVVHQESGTEHNISVGAGLGYFEAVLPVGIYTMVSIGAVYVPPVKSLPLDRFPPVTQKYRLEPLPEAGLPTFPVLADKPLYLGTIRSGTSGDGLVYKGHALEIVDEYREALARLDRRYPVLGDSLNRAGVEPGRHFFLKPVTKPSPLELVHVSSPLDRAREYIEEGKTQQARSWLQTFMPITDSERAEVKLLVGESYLADKKYQDAIEELGDVLTDDPENVRALRLLARAHSLGGHREDALGLYRALAQSVPDDAEASLHLGYDSALASNEELAEQWFDAAFRTNADYLLHDLTPYALALAADGADYLPPNVVDGAVEMPKTMRSRRSSGGIFGALLDHEGRLVAIHLSPGADDWARTMMMTIVRARFRPARLNGVPIPCLLIVGDEDSLGPVR